MKLKRKNIIVVIALSSLVFFACSPQIRFSSNRAKYYGSSKSYTSKPVNSAKNTDGIKPDSNLRMMLNSDIDTKRKEILAYAESLLGTPYCYGGADKSCTDCSGFVLQIYQMAGINLPRTAALQYEYGQTVDDKLLSPGDLVFFIRNNKIGHVGIYIGNNEFIHASTNSGVILQSLDDGQYRQTYAGGKSVL